jgi:hypothetical protein
LWRGQEVPLRFDMVVPGAPLHLHECAAKILRSVLSRNSNAFRQLDGDARFVVGLGRWLVSVSSASAIAMLVYCDTKGIGADVLDLSQCVDICDGDLGAIAPMVVEKREVVLSNCVMVTDAGVEKVAASYDMLQRLSVCNLPRLTDAVCMHLANHCKQLSALDISGCTGVRSACALHARKLLHDSGVCACVRVDHGLGHRDDGAALHVAPLVHCSRLRRAHGCLRGRALALLRRYCERVSLWLRLHHRQERQGRRAGCVCETPL